jgi:serine/threonine-protein kinase
LTEVASRLVAVLADRYRIERALGAGGMATVYLAEDLKHDRKVALKVLKPELAAVLGGERFVQEIKTTAALQHPHILPLFDSGEAGGFLFYVMPYIEGETLRDKLDRDTQLSVDEAVRITTEVADALDYAHRNGVIHRDIKPENILLHDGRPMVADFGIALALSAAAGGRMTETGMSLGTPHYMSPEQATADKDLTARSDVYSLASVLYEMLAGEPPHMGNSAQQIIMKIIAETAKPVTELRRSVPPHVAAAVGKALEKLPADRFDHAAAFAAALTNSSFATVTSGTGAPTAASSSRAPALVVVSVFAAIVTALAAWGWFRSPPPPSASRFRVVLAAHPLEPGAVGRDLALSPDGTTIVFADTAGGTRRLWIKTADRAEAELLDGTEGAFAPAFSPDGAWIAFVADGNVRKVARTGGSAVAIGDSAARLPMSPAVAWLDNGTIAYTDQRFGLSLVGQDGGPIRRFEYISTVGMGVASVGALEGGDAVLLGLCDWGCPAPNLFVADLETGGLDTLVAGGVRGWQLADGRILVARLDGGVFAARLARNRRQLSAAPTPVLDGVRTSEYWADLALAMDGTLLYVPGPAGAGGREAEIVRVTREGRVTPVDSGWSFMPTVNGGIRLSPDDRRLALGVISSAREEVWVKQLDQGPFVRLSLEGSGVRPEWSPDGRDVLYFGARGAGKSDLRRRRADGAGTAEVLLDASRAVWELQPTGDADRFVVRLGMPPSRDVYLLDRTKGDGDSAITPLMADDRYEETAIGLSPDGRWLAYTSNESGRQEVYVRPFPDVHAGRWQISGDGGSEPRWARSGRELFYRRVDGMLVSVAVTLTPTFEPGAERALFSVSGYVGNFAYSNYDVTRDDRQFMFIRPVATPGDEGPATAILVQHWLTELDANQGADR